MSDGILALSSFQGALEETRGTPVPATRKFGMKGWFVPNDDLHSVSEQRNTFIENFRQFKTKRWAELRGLTTSPTFEDLSWFLLQAASGDPDVSTVDTDLRKRLFAPGFNDDDLLTATLEAASNVQDYQFPFSLLDKLELEFFSDRAAVMTLDYLAQQAVPQDRTADLTDRVVEDINGALGKCYIDASSIGETLQTAVNRAKFSLPQNWQQLFTFNGFLHSDRAYRKVRSLNFELDIVFDSQDEMTAFLNADDRAIRYTVEGSVAGATTGVKQLDVDVYGKYGAYSQTDQNGVFIAKVSGNTKFDASATYDWAIAVTDAETSLP